MKNGEFIGISPSKLFFGGNSGTNMLILPRKMVNQCWLVVWNMVILPRNMVLEWDLKLAIICD